MRKPTISFWLLILVILLAVTWIFFPEENLEPIIVLMLAIVSIFPLIRSDLIPWFEHIKLQHKNFKSLSGSTKINACELTISEILNGDILKLNLIKQKFHQYPTKVCAYFEQTDLRFRVYFDKGQSIELPKFFNVGYEEVDEPPSYPKNTNEYIVAQFDIDGDGIDELILGVIDCDEQIHNVQLSVYKFHPPLFAEDLNRIQNWQSLGTLTAHGIIGAVKIELEKGAICIPRNHRDFYYKWTLADSKFIDIGDY
ncbi:hypothetical protein CWC02_01685 [Pseudoalteromonas sp. S2721]|uniref:hypothetical protein n=1 Tax=Pseudoalteromonas sp. S2721 TaxID=579526 RepID=UPI00110B00D4|nr:hypothetical protein [Pseudoalteromonas sp. S2721]TMP21263.1 hypothetical protein CWC02_01685 [Pseudoalteromonas sp. S2721]